jgi:hypothetical protein
MQAAETFRKIEKTTKIINSEDMAGLMTRASLTMSQQRARDKKLAQSHASKDSIFEEEEEE